MEESDYVSATALLSRGAEYAAANRSEYTKILFLLSKGMVWFTLEAFCNLDVGLVGHAFKQNNLEKEFKAITTFRM